MDGDPLGKYAFVPLIVLSFILLPIGGAVGSPEAMGIDGQDHAGEGQMASVRTPAHFTENLGQWPMEVDLVAKVSFGHIGLSGSGFVYDIACPGEGKGNILRYDLVDPSGTGPVGSDPLPFKYSYFFGNDEDRWVSGASNYREAVYKNVWDGIDIRFQLGDEGAKYEFCVKPSGRPEDISFRVSGHRSIRTDGRDLLIELEDGRTFRESDLRAFYEGDELEPVDVRFDIGPGGLISFEVGEYDMSRNLIIDPLLLNSTFLGSTGSESAGMTAIDEDGNIYVLGSCASSGFPTTPGSYNTSMSGYYDIVVFKMDRDLSKLIYSTYIGGKDLESPSDIAYAGNGEVVIVGKTNSNDLPTTSESYQTALNSTNARASDLFVIRLNRTGGKLIGSTYLGWASDENDPCLALNDTGCPVIFASIWNSTIPTNARSYDATFNGVKDIVVLGMSSDLGSLDYASFLGGAGSETPEDLEVGADGKFYFTGTTGSKDFPVTGSAYETVFNSTCYEVGVAGRFDMSTGKLDVCSFINFFLPRALKLNSKGDIVLGGITNSTSFKTTKGCYQSSLGGWYDLAVISMNGILSNVIASTFFGGPDNETLFDIDVNGTDCVYMTGIAYSTFPVTPGAYSTKIAGFFDCFVSALHGDLSKPIYSTFIGGSNWEYPYTVMMGSNESVYISGYTSSSNFPTTMGSYSPTFAGVTDFFISRMVCPKVYLRPTAPRNLTGEMFDDHVALRWEAPLWDGDAGIIGYNITRSAEYGMPSVMGTTTNLTFNDTTIDNSLTYTYNVTAFNRIGDSPPSKGLIIWETVPPIIHSDLTPRSHPPGKDLVFTVNVTDNSFLRKVEVFHWSEDTEVVEDQMTGTSGDLFTFTVGTDDREYAIEYFFTAFDIKDNSVTTGIGKVNISGDYLPVFEEDLTARTVSSLGPLRFSARVRDNWACPVVSLEFWTGDGNHRNVTMVPGKDDEHSYDTRAIGLPGEVITYIYRAEDMHGNWNSTDPATVLIVDGGPPSVLSDLSDRTATTGDPYAFRVQVYDDVKVGDVSVSYRFGEGPITGMALSHTTGEIWQGSMIVPDSTSPLWYRFVLTDDFGNADITQWKCIDVTDNDAPVIVIDSSDRTAYDGEPFTFSCSVKDNVATAKVTVDHWLNGGPRSTLVLDDGSVLKGTIAIPEDAVGTLDYVIRVLDASGNENASGMVSVAVMDAILPTVDGVDDITTYVGIEVLISVEVRDNMEVSSVIWTGLPEYHEGTEWSGSFDHPGIFPIGVAAMDPSNNSGFSTFKVTVLPGTSDLDGDGLPDLFETAHGLDPQDGSDASLDKDEDGLSNLEEYEIGTEFDRSDTDADGMDDMWESENGLDPLEFSAFEDPDEDGRPNIQEYNEGTDPLVANFDDEEEGQGLNIFGYAVLALLLFVSAGLLVHIIRSEVKRRDHLK